MRIDLASSDVTAYALQISTDSLGDHSYVVVVADQAVAIDIQRDLDRFEHVLDGVDADLVAVLETHIHNDYVSGGKRLAELHGAEYVLPANSGAGYEHRPMRDGDTLPIGPWRLRAMHTPGHTFNHTSYVLESGEGPVAIFSGGSLLVGAVGRSDLLGPDHTEALLAHQYASAHRIAEELPDPSVLAPTHGTGSFCSASAVADTTSTIGAEKAQNPALIAPTVEMFALGQVMGYKQYPAYYRHMAPANLLPMGEPPTTALTVVEEIDAVEGATLVDVRPFEDYALGHLPGALSFEASNDAAVYMGWTLPWGRPMVLIGGEAEVAEVRVQLQRIGWDAVIGRIDPGSMSNLVDVPLDTTEIVTYDSFDPTSADVLVDVRDPVEHRAGIIEGAIAVHLADFVADTSGYEGRKVTIHCETGYRAAIAAGFAEASGAAVAVVRDDLKDYSGDLVAPAV